MNQCHFNIMGASTKPHWSRALSRYLQAHVSPESPQMTFPGIQGRGCDSFKRRGAVACLYECEGRAQARGRESAHQFPGQHLKVSHQREVAKWSHRTLLSAICWPILLARLPPRTVEVARPLAAPHPPARAARWRFRSSTLAPATGIGGIRFFVPNKYLTAYIVA